MAAPPESVQAAKSAGLVYSSDEEPGITRERRGKGFAYRSPDGSLLTDQKTKRRIKQLVLPPAWEDVWICPSPRGHIQATGRDARGRKQYRYHDDWREARDSEKFGRMIAFGKALPKIREQIDHDLRRHGMPKERAIAAVVALLEATLIRIGNDEYAKENGSYGLTTLKARHAIVHGGQVEFRFKGKGGKKHQIALKDRRLAAMIKRLQELPGQHLFSYEDADGETHHVSSSDVNEYLHKIVGDDFTAKDFRTWAATRQAFAIFLECEDCESQAARKRAVSAALKEVAQILGNTPAVCRKSYVHSGLLECAMEGLPLKCRKKKNIEDALICFLQDTDQRP